MTDQPVEPTDPSDPANPDAPPQPGAYITPVWTSPSFWTSVIVSAITLAVGITAYVQHGTAPGADVVAAAAFLAATVSAAVLAHARGRQRAAAINAAGLVQAAHVNAEATRARALIENGRSEPPRRPSTRSTTSRRRSD